MTSFHFIVGGMNTLSHNLLLANKVLAFAPTRLKGMACEPTTAQAQ